MQEAASTGAPSHDPNGGARRPIKDTSGARRVKARTPTEGCRCYSHPLGPRSRGAWHANRDGRTAPSHARGLLSTPCPPGASTWCRAGPRPRYISYPFVHTCYCFLTPPPGRLRKGVIYAGNKQEPGKESPRPARKHPGENRSAAINSPIGGT